MTKIQNNKITAASKWALGLILFAVFTILFYRQSIAYEGRYFSDLPAHISFATNGQGYSLLYFCLGVILRLLPGTIGVAVFESLLVIGSWIMAEKLMVKYFQIQRLTASLLSAGLLFLSSIYIPRIAPYFYAKGIVTRPWHNITFFGMCFFAVITMYYFLEILQHYQEKMTWLDWVKIAVPLMLATSVKPNFLIAFSFTLLLFLIVDFFGGKLTSQKFWHIILMGTTVFPACIVLLFQSVILYGPSDGGESSGIMITLFGSEFFQDGIKQVVLKLARGLTFPALVFLFNRKRLDRSSLFMWAMYLITLLQVILLHETGERANHGNFYWGLYSSGYFLFIWYASRFVENCKEYLAAEHKKHTWYYICGTLLLAAHLLSGLAYFAILFMGGQCLI